LSALNAGEVKHSFKRVPGLTLVKLPDNLKVEDALVQLKGKSEFLYVEPDWKITLESTEPNDTYFPNQRGLHQPHFYLRFALILITPCLRDTVCCSSRPR